jgi:hypothetical protein
LNIILIWAPFIISINFTLVILLLTRACFGCSPLGENGGLKNWLRLFRKNFKFLSNFGGPDSEVTKKFELNDKTLHYLFAPFGFESDCCDGLVLFG